MWYIYYMCPLSMTQICPHMIYWFRLYHITNEFNMLCDMRLLWSGQLIRYNRMFGTKPSPNWMLIGYCEISFSRNTGHFIQDLLNHLQEPCEKRIPTYRLHISNAYTQEQFVECYFCKRYMETCQKKTTDTDRELRTMNAILGMGKCCDDKMQLSSEATQIT